MMDLICQSCGGSIRAENPLDHKCCGCGKVICQSCCDVFGHIGKGLHGTGNPAETVERLRTEIAELKNKNLRMTQAIRKFAKDWIIAMCLEED